MDSLAAKESPFSNQTTQPDPLENAIAKVLWQWAFLPPESHAEITATHHQLSLMLEFYLCGAFHLIEYTQSRGIWCDGIIELSLKRISRKMFLIFGIAYSPSKLAPFEMEIHFAARHDHQPLRTIIRFGELDAVGEIQWHTKVHNASAIVANRPQCDRDWAVVVELSPTNLCTQR